MPGDDPLARCEGATSIIVFQMDVIHALTLSELHPDIYLYGALLQSAPFLKDDARVPIWDGLYQRAIEALNLESDRAEISGATLIARTLVQW